MVGPPRGKASGLEALPCPAEPLHWASSVSLNRDGNHRGREVSPSTVTEALKWAAGPPGECSPLDARWTRPQSCPVRRRPLSWTFSNSLPAPKVPTSGRRAASPHGCGLPTESPASCARPPQARLFPQLTTAPGTRLPSSDEFNHSNRNWPGDQETRTGRPKQRKQNGGAGEGGLPSLGP